MSLTFINLANPVVLGYDLDVNARLKLPENQRFEIAMAVQSARSFECPRCSSPAGLHRRSLGGKRGPGGSPLSRPQPPEAVAEGQSLQGTIARPGSVTEGDDRAYLAARMPRSDSAENVSLVGQ